VSLDPALTVRPLNVPAVAAPAPIVAALDAFEQRRQDYRRAVQALREAQAGVTEADRLDLLAVADARDAGHADPLPVNRERARRAVEAARHDEQVEQLRLERAHAALVDAVEAHAQAWAQAASQARVKADSKAAKALTQLRQAEDERAELRRVDRWLSGLATGASFDYLARKGAAVVAADTALSDPRNQGRQLTASELMAALEDYFAATTEQTDERRVAERASKQAEDERRREDVRLFRQAHPGLPVPD
jgi:hypothetical protein